eukprot:TRINITY_DN70741_c0_g1_i1.p1 TRINITY_DN70741_c0_g1~~TRINITY_DN70741_c0_g1_i1.p1  ORF type:complete len:406 (-),score=51.12 TRINITY_DN70741_c0_g1_i1:196-1347(-)
MGSSIGRVGATTVVERGYSALSLLVRDSGERLARTPRSSRGVMRQPSTTETSEKESLEIDIEEDTWGVFILAAVYSLHRCKDGGHGHGERVACFFAFGLYVLNFVVQLSLVWFVQQHAVNPAIRSVQGMVQYFHAGVFDTDGQFLRENWDAFDKEGLCQIAMRDVMFSRLIIFIWTTTMMVEIRACDKLLVDILAMPVCSNANDMVTMSSDVESRVLVVGLTKPVRLSLIVFVCIPRLLLALLLLQVGFTFLTASLTLKDLLLNAVAIKFIMNIDEMLYLASLPELHREAVAKASFVQPRTEDDSAKMQFSAYKRSLGFWFVAFCYMYISEEVLQTVLPPSISEMTSMCSEWEESIGSVRCALSSFDYFLNPGLIRQCFPVGD